MKCNVCPRHCNAERTEHEGKGFCHMGTLPVVSRAAAHYWEEPCLSGTRGSGTVFFSGCSLGCVFCQNEPISHHELGRAMTPRQLAAHIERETGIAHIRVCGAADVPCTRVTGMFGTPGGVFEELKSEKSEIVMTGEACEWMLGEYARDAAQLGHKKALLILGHIGSERDGMRYLADELKRAHPEIPCAYFECGEVYTYTDR